MDDKKKVTGYKIWDIFDRLTKTRLIDKKVCGAVAMVAKQQWSPNKNGRQTKMVAGQEWSPNKNGRQTKMVAEQKWSPNKNDRQTEMVAKQKWSPNRNGRQTEVVTKQNGRRTEILRSEVRAAAE